MSWSVGKVASSVGPGILERFFMWAAVVSFALHMLTAVWSVRSASFNSLLRVRSSDMPHTIRSVMRLSVSAPNSQDFAFILKFVTYLSMGSLGCWFLVWNTWRSQVRFSFGLQYASSFSIILPVRLLSPSFSQVKVLYSSSASSPAMCSRVAARIASSLSLKPLAMR